MCNYKRYDSRDIPKTGNGFKIVLIDENENGEWSSPVHGVHLQKHNVWDEDYSFFVKEYGFCFFLTFSDAYILMNELRQKENCKIVDISYKGGICMQKEGFKYVHYNSCLCKEFTFIDYPIYDNKEE